MTVEQRIQQYFDQNYKGLYLDQVNDITLERKTLTDVITSICKGVQEEQIENDCFCIEQNTDVDTGNCYINPTTLKKETRRVIP